MKLLILSLLTSGAISAAVGGAGLGARDGPQWCNCRIKFNSQQSIYSWDIPTSPGETQINANYVFTEVNGKGHQYNNACRVTYDRGQNPKNCASWTQTHGPDGPNCPKSIFVKGHITCTGSDHHTG
ncbi:uncharacterized protein RAG0_13926 [Rhynchosporium agropyri]|uniref:Uncharacterized protein n=1 Tax=Rhynchosporium agropyri TaxID=914238 RepID=A0A1E1LEY2_9HELO|nr:uncharacterized protein RAG0_13926 [Rhynchosporium agropyri]